MFKNFIVVTLGTKVNVILLPRNKIQCDNNNDNITITITNKQYQQNNNI